MHQRSIRCESDVTQPVFFKPDLILVSHRYRYDASADAFGNALGNSIVRASQSDGTTNGQSGGGDRGSRTGSQGAGTTSGGNTLNNNVVEGANSLTTDSGALNTRSGGSYVTEDGTRAYTAVLDLSEPDPFLPFSMTSLGMQVARNGVASANQYREQARVLGDRVSQVNARIAATAGQNTIRDASYLAQYNNERGNGLIELPTTPGPWRDGYIFPDDLNSEGLLAGLLDVAGDVSTGLTSGYLVSQLPLGGIELSSQRLLFNTADSIVGYTDQFGRLTQTATTGVLGGLPIYTDLNNPTFSVLSAGENVANGNLGIAFNGNDVAGKFNSISIADTLDSLGQKVFVAQTIFQGTDLLLDIKNDPNRVGLNFNSLSPETQAKTLQTGLDIGFGAIGTFGGPLGATIGLAYTFREPLFDASRINFESQVRENQFNIENNLPPRVGPKF